MNDLQKALETTEATIKALQSYAEDIRNRMQPVVGVKQWEPKGGYFQIDCECDVVRVNSFSHKKEFGTKRIAKEQAERAAVEMRRFNRLLALRDELCGDEIDFDWSNAAELKYSVYFYHLEKAWRVTGHTCSEYFAPYFTSKEIAQRACDMLNSGEVSL
jgi:hypothetical protein